VRDIENFARDVIYGAKNLLQNGCPPEGLLSSRGEKIEYEQCEISIFSFFYPMMLDTRKIVSTTFDRSKILSSYVRSDLKIFYEVDFPLLYL